MKDVCTSVRAYRGHVRWMGPKGLELPRIVSHLILVLSTVLRSST